MSELFGKYGLPLKVEYCKKCTISNQRPSSAIEFQQRSSDKKDSVIAAHILKYKYKMNPLTVTWPPNMYTDIGTHNFHGWLNSGLANYTYFPNQQVHRKLTELAFKELVHPFQPFILGQKNIAPKISAMFNIPLVFYGENEAEYGNAIENNEKPIRDRKYYSAEYQLEDIYLAGHSAKELLEINKWRLSDIDAYLPANPYKLEETKTEIHYLGYYIKWHPQEVYYYSVENTSFSPNFRRTEGSFSKYSSLDDKIDWLHWYTYHAKFGIARATFDAAQEIRNGDITRDEGIALIKRFDGEYPKLYLNDILNYLNIFKEEFDEIIDNARPNHLWEKNNGQWELKHPIWKENR